MKKRIEQYFSTIENLLQNTKSSTRTGQEMSLDDAFVHVMDKIRTATKGPNKVMFVGNGGSAGITSHMAIDFSKNGGMRALSFNDGAYLTCLANDLGYENVFSKAIDIHAVEGDVLFAISSSGSSPNIINAVKSARAKRCFVITLSGFSSENPLRKMGDMNFYTASGEYGFVEIAHLAIIHAILDIEMGWAAD